jgi:tRNA dimethylallyltransferase
MSGFNCIVVLGPTASGKTRLACGLAFHLNGEIISADSRQVYKGLDIGTGKDFQEYIVDGKQIPYHLIDIADPSEQFYLHDFTRELSHALSGIISRNKIPIICGGTGLYLDALRKDFSLTSIPEDDNLRLKMKDFSKEQLINVLDSFPHELAMHVDRSSVKRIIRGIEVATFTLKHGLPSKTKSISYSPFYLGININIEERKRRISERLRHRLNNGLIDEVSRLLSEGVSSQRLEMLGLEYKFVSRYLDGRLNIDELFDLLQTAIFQFAKRQMTWFRKMEREGVKINWVDSSETPEEIIEKYSLKDIFGVL